MGIDYRIRVLWVYIWESFILRWLLETWDGKSLPRERGQKKREGSQRQLLGKHLNPGVGRRPRAREAGELGQNCAPGAMGGEIFHKKWRINIDRLEKGACGQILRKGFEFKFFDWWFLIDDLMILWKIISVGLWDWLWGQEVHQETGIWGLLSVVSGLGRVAKLGIRTVFDRSPQGLRDRNSDEA